MEVRNAAPGQLIDQDQSMGLATGVEAWEWGDTWGFHEPRLPLLLSCSQALMPSLLASGRGHSPAVTTAGWEAGGCRNTGRADM